MLGMLPLFALLPAALAGPLDARVSGLESAKAVHLLVRAGSDLTALDCNDAGRAPDVGPDGVWTCGPGELDAEAATVGLLVDGKLVEAGEARWTGSSRLLSVDRSGGATQLSTTTHLGSPEAGGDRVGPGQTLLVEVRGFEGEGAPVVHVATPSGKRQLNCGDDGTFPDSERNDGVLGCSGVLPGSPATLTLFPAGGDPLAFGEVDLGDGPVVELVVDVTSVTLTAAATGLLRSALVPVEAPVGTPGPSPEPVPPKERPGGEEEDIPVGEPAPPPEPVPPKEREAGSAANGSAPLSMAPPSHPLADPGVIALGVVAVAIGAGVIVGRRRRPGGALEALERVPSRPLFDGGPAISDGGCQLRTADPGALAIHLVPRLARTRRLLVASAVPLELPPTDGASAWRATKPHIDDLVESARALAARHGPELAVVLVGQDAALAPGDVASDLAQELDRRLPSGAFLCQIVPPDAPRAAWLRRYEVHGPPWEGTGDEDEA